jgi:hypothetical protein
MKSNEKIRATRIVRRIFKRFEELYTRHFRKFEFNEWWKEPHHNNYRFYNKSSLEWDRTITSWSNWTLNNLKDKDDLLIIKDILNDIYLKKLKCCLYYPPKLDHFEDIFMRYKNFKKTDYSLLKR